MDKKKDKNGETKQYKDGKEELWIFIYFYFQTKELNQEGKDTCVKKKNKN